MSGHTTRHLWSEPIALTITHLPGTLHNFTLGWFTTRWEDDSLVIDPPFQRGSVWTPTQREAFIETLLDDLPRPAFFVNEFFHGPFADRAVVIDGRQRLDAIFSFMYGSLRVRGEWFDEQSKAFQRKFELGVAVPVVLTRYETMRECAELYVRLLRTGTAHTEAEIQHAEKMLADGEFE